MSVARWLSVIGLGEDGGLSPAATQLLSQASLVVGGARHLAMIGKTPGRQMAWPSPIENAFPAILAKRGEPVCVLATGDPFFYGVGSVLATIVAPAEMVCLPQPSAFSLAAARLGWALQDCALVSLHGRALDRIVPHLHPGAKILALSWDGETPARVAALLCEHGLGGSTLTICEALGGPRERMRSVTAATFDLAQVNPMNTIALEIAGSSPLRIPPRAPGLPEEWFDNDGQITKAEMRALTISALAPRPGETLWDIGSGSGSVAIEWLLSDPATQAVAIERRPDRCARIAGNAAALGVSRLRVVQGDAPAVLADLGKPHAIFIGGGLTKPGLFEAAWAALGLGCRLVTNTVTLEGQSAVTELYARHGGKLVQVQFARADVVGRFHGFRPSMPVTQWSVVKP